MASQGPTAWNGYRSPTENPNLHLYVAHHVSARAAARHAVYGRLSDPSVRRAAAETVLEYLEFLDAREAEEGEIPRP